MLRTKLFLGFAVLVVLLSLLSAYVGVQTINSRVREEAQMRVRMDLNSAWAVWNGQLSEIGTIVRLAAATDTVHESCRNGGQDLSAVHLQLEKVRVGFGLDFLDLLSAQGRVMLRTAPPGHSGDLRMADPAVMRALKGEAVTGVSVMTRTELEQEGAGLAEQAFLELEDTPKARRSPRTEESRGMVMVAAVPVMDGTQVTGVLYGGILINRNHALVDRIHDDVYGGEMYQDRPVGSATIFLDDSRIATTVRLENGNRALGTRVSKEVADHVLDNGLPWVGEAFVVRNWDLTAYEPIRDGFGEVIGMLYVGILKQPYTDAARDVALRYLFLSLFALVVALVLAFFIASRLASPIHRLVQASNSMRKGEYPGAVSTEHACHETGALIMAFNQMAGALSEREAKLKAINRSYMETLGFVSHELKSPVATIMNYAYLLREQKLGPVNEKQAKAIRVIDSGSHRLVEMVRHYLNLSRIENNELRPVMTRVQVLDDVLTPILEGVERDVAEKAMHIENRLTHEVVLHADVNMVREVFENMISNAIKYGREGGRIEINGREAGSFYEFAVRNEGEGIPRDRMADLFQKFSRIEASKAAHKQKGTGLGLFITKHIVEAHGGTIRATSEPGAWAEFVFTLPRQDGSSSGTGV